MRIPRFYQAQIFQAGQQAELSAENFRHAIQVMRLGPGDKIVLFNGQGGEYEAALTGVSKRQAQVEITAYNGVSRESPLATRLVMALIKPDKMDFALQKAVEMGVNSIQPVHTSRSVIRLKGSRLQKKIQHWQGVMINACEQSGRTIIPELLTPLELADYLQQDHEALQLVMLPDAGQTLSDLAVKPLAVELLVGPEGGFTGEEAQQLNQAGVTAIRFGPRTMRAETSVVAGLGALQQLWGDC